MPRKQPLHFMSGTSFLPLPANMANTGVVHLFPRLHRESRQNTQTVDKMAGGNCRFPEETLTVANLIMLTIVVSEATVGLWINGFIVVTFCTDRFKNRFLSAGERILASLAINRICFLFTGMFHVLCRQLSPSIYYSDFVFWGVRALHWFFMSSNLSFAACLCIFYCVKIAIFSHSLFIHLKLKISRMVPALLLGSVLLSLINTTHFFRVLYTTQCDVPNPTASGNVTANPIQKHTDLLTVFLFCGFFPSVVFVIFIISALLLLVSLWRHIRQAKDGSATRCTPQMDAHVRAVKVIVSFLITYLFNFMALMCLLTNLVAETGFISFLCRLVLNTCPFIHSIMLILTNPKYKEAFFRLLQLAKCK